MRIRPMGEGLSTGAWVTPTGASIDLGFGGIEVGRSEDDSFALKASGRSLVGSGTNSGGAALGGRSPANHGPVTAAVSHAERAVAAAVPANAAAPT